jgi:hypothetical protein
MVVHSKTMTASKAKTIDAQYNIIGAKSQTSMLLHSRVDLKAR